MGPPNIIIAFFPLYNWRPVFGGARYLIIIKWPVRRRHNYLYIKVGKTAFENCY
jgi:hypothetical protein